MSNTIESFVNQILPANYWITKSMEFSKVSTSGTLWYLKKWIVYYNYLFFKSTLTQSDYNEIAEIFNSFIESLPENQETKTNAKNFFFDIDIRDNSKYITLNDFIKDTPNFDTPKELEQHILSAKKFYFTYIMNLGGQSGYKKYIKELIIDKNSYTETLSKLSEKLSADAKDSDYKMLINDFHAALRNERQIFFYYGLFHGKETADLSGFYNLTNIGKSILNSSFDELLLIWEHQKILMVSQSPLTDIQKLDDDIIDNPELFEINCHPYISLLEIMVNNNAITLDEYQYVISRTHLRNDISFISENISELLENSKSKVEDFNRIADNKDEDFKKELAKFILGISDMSKDENSNYYSFLTKYNSKKVSINNIEKAKFILKHYKYISSYLDSTYKTQYEIFSSEIKKQYISKVNSSDYTVDITAQYEWSKYIINIDKNIYMGLIYLLTSMKLENFQYSLKEKHFKSAFESFKLILKSFGIKKKTEFVILMLEIQEHFKENNELYINIAEENEYQVIDPKEYESKITLINLNELSLKTAASNNVSRKRDISLIQTIKSYYFTEFIEDGNLKCDCCKETTFITTKGYPYIEFHHLIPFSTDNGPDHYLNLFGLCPNCHRKMHFIRPEEKSTLYSDLNENNNLSKSIIERIDTLLEQNILEAIHLEFLLKENIISKDTYDRYMDGEVAA